jgi:hypothetical protein
MNRFILSPPLLGFVVGTRVALAFGLGLLAANRVPAAQRRRLALALIGIGAISTIPAARAVFKSRTRVHEFPADEEEY